MDYSQIRRWNEITDFLQKYIRRKLSKSHNTNEWKVNGKLMEQIRIQFINYKIKF